MKHIPKYWMLDEHGTPVPTDDTLTWANWFENSRKKRIVKQETVNGLFISTVFLGLDHNWGEHDTPVLWETMVFDKTGEHPWMEEDMDRCGGNREQAEAMHERMVEKIKNEPAKQV